MGESKPSSIAMPEITLYDTLNAIFKIIKDDYRANEHDTTKSMLWYFFGKDDNDNDIKLETFNYFKQAKEMFVDRTVNVNIGYNMELSPKGCIHILLPNETGMPLGIGTNENYQGNFIEKNPDGKNNYRAQFTANYDATYNLMITSENTLEVILIYNLIKAALLTLTYHLSLSGLLLPRISGQDVNVQSDLVPNTIFHRSLMLNFQYELSVPDFFTRKIITNFASAGIIISNTNTNS